MDYTHYLAAGAGAVLLLAIQKLWKVARKELDDLEKDDTHIPAEKSDYN
jgi:hypothetical protein